MSVEYFVTIENKEATKRYKFLVKGLGSHVELASAGQRISNRTIDS